MLNNQDAIKFKIKHLKKELDYGRIEGEFAEKFIENMYEKCKLDYYPYSQKQIDKIDQMFEAN